MRFLLLALVIAGLALLPARGAAEVVLEPIEYEHDGVLLEGWIAYDTAATERRPGVLVVHEWTGVNDYQKRRARQLAEMGYVAFAADIFGKGVNPTPPTESGQMAGSYRNNPVLFRARVKAGLDQLRASERVDSAKLAAIGYCFGGTAVLELARSGEDIAGVVSFHGGLGTRQPAEKDAVKARVLVLHGAIDPYVPPTEVNSFVEEMEAAGVDYEFVAYAGAVHSFTNPGAGDDPSRGSAYQETADKRSWRDMKIFLAEVFDSHAHMH